MTKYAPWREETVNITNLKLDVQNPRIPELGHLATQREIVEELVNNDGVYELTRDIATQGFFPTELLVCVEEADELIVIEGNRRLASLKLLLSPQLAPDKWAKRFAALSAKLDEPATKVVKIIIAPSRSAAAPLIMNRHTQTGIKRWEPIQQARYVHSLRSSGMSIEQLAATTGFTRGELLKVLRTHTMYEVANTLGLDPKTADTVRDPRKFNTSTLERIIESPVVRKFLGISFNEEGQAIGEVHPDDFKKAYKRIITDIAKAEVDTRKLNNAKAVQSYVAQLVSVKPKRKGHFTSLDLLQSATSTATNLAPAGKPKARSDRKSKFLVPKSVKCHLHMTRIADILSELQRLKVSGFENAVAVLLRIFIEMSISHYMESTGSMNALVARLNKNGNKPADWTPSFRQMLGDILQNDKEIIAAIPKQALKALNKAVSNDNYPLSLDSMDQFVHNPYVAPTEHQLRQLWNAFESLTAYLMEDHKPNSSHKGAN